MKRLIALLSICLILFGALQSTVISANAQENTAAAAETTDDAPRSYCDVPLYLQNDYPDVPYGSGTIATCGCSVTSLAMVATYLTGNTYLPDELAGYFVEYDTPNLMDKLEHMSDMLQLPWEKAGNVNDALNAVKDGKVVIALMGSNSLFTTGQHFIVWADVNEEGKILVNDPNASNYALWNLKNAFVNGFSEGSLLCGYKGAWIYDPAEMPEEPFVYTDSVEETVGETEPTHSSVARTHCEMPLYLQNDYPNVRYGAGSIATSGCSVTSLAMVSTYLTGHTYLPDELADYFSDYNSINHMDKLEYMSDQLQLPWERAENFHVAMKALQEGKIVIALMESDSLFTDGQHFIVWAGINEDGKIWVNDPNAQNYELWNLKSAFRKGFTEGDLCLGYSGGWIYDPDAMPEEPFIYTEEKVEVECRYPGVELTLEEQHLLAKMVWVEAQGEPFEGQQAVAEVVLNRLVSEGFPNTIKGIIYAENQFRSTAFLDTAEPYNIQYEAIERALEGPYVLPEDVVFFATYPVNENVWGRIGGHVFCHQTTASEK